MTAAAEQDWYRLILGDILDLIASQPPQVLLSIGSITIVAAEAEKMVPFPANIAIAIGAEWAYLRGIASSGKSDKGWTTALNWGALALVVLYGLLWGARKFGGIPQQPTEVWAWMLTIVHIIPVAFVSFAAAMVHRSSVIAVQTEIDQREQAAEQRRLEREQRELDLEIEYQSRRRELDLWTQGQRAKVEIKQLSQVSQNSVTDSAVTSVTPQQDKENRELLRQRVVQIVTEARQNNGVLNVSQAWKDAGLSSRSMWYKLIKEAEAKGEL